MEALGLATMGRLGHGAQTLPYATYGRLYIQDDQQPPPIGGHGASGPVHIDKEKPQTMRDIMRRQRILREDQEILDIVTAMIAQGVFDEDL